MQSNHPMHTLSRDLIAELTDILNRPSYIHFDGIDDDADRMPVPRYVIRAVVDALDLSVQQLELYRNMTRDLAHILRHMLATDPALVGLPVVAAAQRILTKVEEFNAR